MGTYMPEAPWWEAMGLTLKGFDEGENDGGDSEGSDGSEDNEGDEDNDDNDSGSGQDQGESVEGLKSALRKERRERKKFERELKKRQQADSENKDADQVQEALDKVRKSDETVARLAARLKEQAVERAILRHAKDFADPEDAVLLINRDDLDIDQDDDDPLDISIDDDSVKDAVRALAKKKPHLLSGGKSGGGQSNEDATGSKIGSGGRKGTDQQATEQRYREMYPALGN